MSRQQSNLKGPILSLTNLAPELVTNKPNDCLDAAHELSPGQGLVADELSHGVHVSTHQSEDVSMIVFLENRRGVHLPCLENCVEDKLAVFDDFGEVPSFFLDPLTLRVVCFARRRGHDESALGYTPDGEKG
jgi:hypothetical protein